MCLSLKAVILCWIITRTSCKDWAASHNLIRIAIANEEMHKLKQGCLHESMLYFQFYARNVGWNDLAPTSFKKYLLMNWVMNYWDKTWKNCSNVCQSVGDCGSWRVRKIRGEIYHFSPLLYYGLLGHQDWRTMQVGKEIPVCIKETDNLGLCFCCKTPGHLAKAYIPNIQIFESSAICGTVEHIIASAQITYFFVPPTPPKKILWDQLLVIHRLLNYMTIKDQFPLFLFQTCWITLRRQVLEKKQ